jgi:hypothetical protein
LVIAVTLPDMLVALVLLLSLPALVSSYLKGPGISKSLIYTVTVVGMLWVLYGLISEELLEAVSDLERADSYCHTAMAEALMLGKEPNFFKEIPIGNKAYQTYVYALFLLGAYVPSARAINAFCGLWGGLALAGGLKRYIVGEKHAKWMLLVVIFFPSAVFWTSGNMKEGLTYWGICLMVSAALNTKSRENLLNASLMAGVVVTGFMRPHICFAWLIAICSVTFFKKGQRIYSLIALAALPLLFFKMQELAKHDFSTLDTTVNYLQSHGEGLRQSGGSVQKGPTIPIITGLLAVFFRPFPWEARSFFMAVCALEIWTLTLTMFKAWFSLTWSERRVAWKMPEIRIALFAILITSVLFTYLPNDGLLARQRIQIVPAILIITIIPLCLRNYVRRTRRVPRAPGQPENRVVRHVDRGIPGSRLPVRPVGALRNKGHPS